MLLGNDVSKYQGDINFDLYKNNANFIIVKSSEGVGYMDGKFTRNQAEARRVGLPLGYYHFARPDLGNDPAHEADWMLKVVGSPKEGEFYCLDYEVTYRDPVGWCKNFLDRIKFMLNGYKPLIYLNQYLATNYDWSSVVNADYGLWIAAYTFDPNNNNFKTGAWKNAALQQWTDKQNVPGIAGAVDGNVFFGDWATFKKYGYTTPAPIPPPQPPTPPVEPPVTPPEPPITPPSTIPPVPPTPPIPPVPPSQSDYKNYLRRIKEVINNGNWFWKLFGSTERISEIIVESQV